MNSFTPDTNPAPRSSEIQGDQFNETAGSPPVCIAGMHRSGTSMVAGLLHNCGVFFGSVEDIAPPSLDNPEGFWENQNFVSLNEALIALFGGKWDNPPHFASGWELSPEIVPLLRQASELVEAFRSHGNWGWKDPRNSLTIAFWRRLIPQLKVVICVRNPLEVSHSLFVRGDASTASEFELWLTYYRQILHTIPAAQRLITHYQSYFHDPRAEVRRLADWLELDVSAENVDRACTGVSARLRHHHVTTADLIDAGAPTEVRDLYLELCREAGPVYRQLGETAPDIEHRMAVGPTHPSPTSRMQAMELESLLAKSERQVKLLEIELNAARAKLQTHEAEADSIRPILRAVRALKAVKARFRRS